MSSLVCVSHLRWDFVWQRPQHLLSRLANNYHVLFVEEPIAVVEEGEPRLEVLHRPGNVTVIRLLQPVSKERWIGHGDPLTADVYQKLLRRYLIQEGIDASILWLYTPMAWHFAHVVPHRLMIYDVMDELAAFKGAPSQLIAYEKLALEHADLVFTGGVSLYENKRPYNANTHLFPSGIEIEHFARAARRDNCPMPEEITGLRGPILGYYGVIDERMDIPLLATLAERHADCDILMIGPIVKISPDDLPQAANLHYVGMRSYQQLPSYLAHFDVALIPFAINEATRYLSPTKTLEYMAAHKPIVSTPIKDVMTLYGSVVRVGETREMFCAHVGDALNDDGMKRREKEHSLLAQNTWDNIVARMQTLIEGRVSRRTA